MANNAVQHPALPTLNDQGPPFPRPPAAIVANAHIPLPYVEETARYEAYLQASDAPHQTRQAAQRRKRVANAKFAAQTVSGPIGAQQQPTNQQLLTAINTANTAANTAITNLGNELRTLIRVSSSNAQIRQYNMVKGSSEPLEWVQADNGTIPAQPCRTKTVFLLSTPIQSIDTWLGFYNLGAAGDDNARRLRLLKHLGS